jgi:uncharacterized protein YbjT (DUF2867 family)
VTMRIVIFGVSGMVGRGALRESLADPEVDEVLIIGRTASGEQHPKLREIIRPDLLDYAPLAADLAGIDACFFCLGVSSAGLSESDYRHVTYDITLAAARALLESNPQLVFIYVSGAGTDSSEQGRTMWARVKGQTENALLALPFKAAFMLRPGLIEPLDGIRSKTRSYRLSYALITPLWPLLHALFPKRVTSTRELGQVMLALAKRGADGPIIEARDIARLATARS